jgi:tRNA nucleotidyltransferase (CCA-adding enzyme)
VRDALRGIPPQDFDGEVFHLTKEALQNGLRHRLGNEENEGRPFGVFKFKNDPRLTLSLPRTEIRTGHGHSHFSITIDPSLSLRKAAVRRDFTVNAIFWDPETENLVDPFGGRHDLQIRQLRHLSNKFTEDPLRVLRGMQMIGRFQMTMASHTLRLCRTMTPFSLSTKKITDEFRKLFLVGSKPSWGFRFLETVGWIRWFPVWNRGHRHARLWKTYLAELDRMASENEEAHFQIFLHLTHEMGQSLGVSSDTPLTPSLEVL